MLSEHWLGIGLGLSTLVAPLGPKVVDWATNRTNNKRKKPRRRNGKLLVGALPEPKTSWAWVLYFIALSLTILVGYRSYNLSELAVGSTVKIGSLAILIFNLQVTFMVANLNERKQRRKDREVAITLSAISRKLESIARARERDWSNWRDGHIKIQNRLQALSETTLNERPREHDDLEKTRQQYDAANKALMELFTDHVNQVTGTLQEFNRELISIRRALGSLGVGSEEPALEPESPRQLRRRRTDLPDQQ